METLKSYVQNKAQPEGCITEQYIVQRMLDILLYVSRNYSDNIQQA